MSNNKITELVDKNENYRKKGINLIASENHLNKEIRDMLASDFAGRYHSDYYGGSKYAQEIVKRTEELAEELFDVEHAFVKPLSGNICDLNVLFSFTEPYDNVAMMDFENGGYPLGLGKFHRKRVSLPVKEGTFEIDVDMAEEIYKKNDIPLTILGASYIPFPHPVSEVDGFIDECIEPGTLVFDGSHVLGLIATGQFQDPLKEGADILIGSTHKSFYGPQGGIILTNSDEKAEKIRDYQDIDLETGIGLIDNPHVNRIAALGATIENLLDDSDYGERVVRNAKELAKSLEGLGVPMKFGEKGYTESHQIFIDVDEEEAARLCHKLEEEDIFIDISARLGVAEVTHLGMGVEDMYEIAEKISEVYKKI